MNVEIEKVDGRTLERRMSLLNLRLQKSKSHDQPFPLQLLGPSNDRFSLQKSDFTTTVFIVQPFSLQLLGPSNDRFSL